MRYLSVCSGIEAATMAWHPLGWTPVGFSEIEKFPSQVLAHHYGSNMPGEEPAANGVPNYGDMTKFEEWPDHAIDLLVGGTPCQSFSVAGLRKGLADPRGNLMLTYLAIARRYQPRWLVWENVPGVLSSGEGRDFGALLTGLAELGYGFAWRVLDAQYVRVDGYDRAVPQRRRRVFVVGHLGDWRRAAAVFLEREGLLGDSPPRRQSGKAVAPTISARPTGGGGLGTDFDLDGGLIASTGDVAHCLNAGGMGRQDYETETMVATRDVAATLTRGAESKGKGGYAGRRQEDDDNLVATPYTLAIRGRDGAPDLEYRQDGTANAILTPNGGRAGIGVGAIAFSTEQEPKWFDGVSPTLKTPSPSGGGQPTCVATGWAVRRLTPTECERLQGFPDGFTDIKPNGKLTADGPRYKALGNSMAVNAMRWIGRRIEMVEKIAANQDRRAA